MIKKDLLKKYKHVFEQPVTLYENFSSPKRTQLNELFEDIYEVCSSNKSGSREYKYGETNDFEDAKRVARNFAIEDTKLTIYVRNKATQEVEYRVKAIKQGDAFILKQNPGSDEYIAANKINRKVYPNRIKECKETITEEKAVTLFAEAEVFDNYSGPGRIVRYKASGKNHLEAVKKIIDKLGFDITSKDIEKESYDFEEVLEQIDMLNGEGDAFLINLKDDQGNEFYVHEGYEQDYEDLDESTDFSKLSDIDKYYDRMTVDEAADYYGIAVQELIDDLIPHGYEEYEFVCCLTAKDEYYDALASNGVEDLILVKDTEGHTFPAQTSSDWMNDATSEIMRSLDLDEEELEEAKAFDFNKLNKKLHGNVKLKNESLLKEASSSDRGYELVAKGYLLYHPYPTDWDVEDIAEELCANCFDEDYENCDPEISYACYQAASDYLDNAGEDLEEAKEFNFDKLNKKLHSNIKL